VDGEDLGAVEVGESLLEPFRVLILAVGVGVEQDADVVIDRPGM